MMYTDEQKTAMRERLRGIAKKKLDTTMIGAISAIEEIFGHLWGQDKDESDLTEDELKYDEMWEKCRERILDCGNRQRRNLDKELQLHTIIYDRYNYVLLPVDEYNKKGYNNQYQKEGNKNV